MAPVTEPINKLIPSGFYKHHLTTKVMACLHIFLVKVFWAEHIASYRLKMEKYSSLYSIV